MKRNMKVIQINGFRGLFLAMFAGSCLIAGFVAFPAFLMMNVWNYLSVTTSSFPQISIWGGVLLWAIIALSAFIFNKRKFIVSFDTKQELTDEEVSEVVSKFKAHAIKRGLLQPKDLNLPKEKIEEDEVTINNKED